MDLSWITSRPVKQSRLKTCDEELERSAEEPRKTGFQDGDKLFELIRRADDEVVVCQVVLGHL